MKRIFFLAGLIVISAITADTMALVPAFPGAEGSGCFTTGGRGGAVYEVNNLTNSGPGSIVDALSAGDRTIVFRVSGTILLGDVILEPKSNTTIAGQTAPGDGICIKGRIHIKNSVHDIIIRYIRVRVDAGGANSNGDAVDIDSCNNVIIDHVTASYSRDEGISCQENSDNITVQWCIMSEALNYQDHSYGSLIRGQYGQEKTYHHNLYAHNKGRNPRPGNPLAAATDPEGLHFDFRNNVVYNWMGSTPGYNEDNGIPPNALAVSRYNFKGNAYIIGLDSSSDTSTVFRERSSVSYGYFADNSLESVVPPDPWTLVSLTDLTEAQRVAYKARSYLIPMEPVTTTSPAQAKIDVLADAGASFPTRDTVDTRIVNDVINKTGRIIKYTGTGYPDDHNEPPPPGGWWPAIISLPAPTDGDHDGMPDAWETSRSLNPSDAADRNGYDLDVNYTNLEVYLNDIIMNSPSVPTGLTATAGYATVALDWNNNSEPDIAGYNVYRLHSISLDSRYSKLNSVLLSDSNYVDNTTTHDTIYYYVVTAVDTSSNEFGCSDKVVSGLYGDFTGNGTVETNDLSYFCDLWLENDCDETVGVDLDENCIVNSYEFSVLAKNWKYIPPDFTPPAAPKDLAATAGDGTVSLDWSDNSEPDVAGYYVYRSTNSGPPYSRLNSTPLTSSDYIDNTVANGTTYYYVVTAVDISSNESAYSNEVSASPLAASSIIIQESEAGFCSVEGSISNTYAGYTGSGYCKASVSSPLGKGINWKISVPSDGNYTLGWRYALLSGDRTCKLIVNTVTVVPSISFPATGAWTTWVEVSVDNVSLTEGANSIRLEATTSSGFANIDYLKVTGDNPVAVSCP